MMISLAAEKRLRFFCFSQIQRQSGAEFTELPTWFKNEINHIHYRLSNTFYRNLFEYPSAHPMEAASAFHSTSFVVSGDGNTLIARIHHRPLTAELRGASSDDPLFKCELPLLYEFVTVLPHPFFTVYLHQVADSLTESLQLFPRTR